MRPFFYPSFTSDLTLVSYVPSRKKTVILLSSQHHDDTCMGEENYNKPEIVMHYNATKSDADILDKLMKEYTCTRPTRHWPLKIFLSLIDIACVNAFVLWMLKYPSGNKRRLIEDACICFHWEKKWKHHI